MPDGEWELVWADEFDGLEFDRIKWDFRLNFWGERFDAYSDCGIVLDGKSHIELHRTEVDGKYVSPQLQTGANSFDHMTSKRENPWGQDGIWPFEELKEPKFVHRFGYYECRCKFPKYPEIREEGRVNYNLEETEDGWHYFGMEWSPGGYVFYCDGKEVSRCNGHVSLVPQFILLTTEVQGYRSVKAGKVKLLGGGEADRFPFLIEDKFKDDAFIVDFVRVYDRVK